VRNREIDQVLQDGAGIRHHAQARCPQLAGAVAQHNAPKPLVGHDQIGAVPDDRDLDARGARGRHRSDEGLGVGGLRVQVGGASDAEARVARKQTAGGNS
jgi:hypothetical protein